MIQSSRRKLQIKIQGIKEPQLESFASNVASKVQERLFNAGNPDSKNVLTFQI